MTRTIDGIPDGSSAKIGAHVATQYYGGQFTALYALASTGSLELRDGDGLGRIITEVRDAIATAEQSEEWNDAADMGEFLEWLESEEKRGN